MLNSKHSVGVNIDGIASEPISTATSTARPWEIPVPASVSAMHHRRFIHLCL